MDAGRRPSFRQRRGGYKPVPLRWPFLVTQMVLLAAAITAVAVLQSLMPDSDDSAYVDGRQRSRRARGFDVHSQVPRAYRRQAGVPGNELFLNATNTTPTATTSTALFVTTVTHLKFGPDMTEPIMVVATAGFDGIVVGKRPPKSKKLNLTQETIATNRTQISYDTTAATTSKDPVARESTDYITLGDGATTVATVLSPARTNDDFGIKNVLPTVNPELEAPRRTQMQTIITTLRGVLTTVVSKPPPTTIISVIEATVITVMTTLSPTTILSTSEGVVVTSIFTPPPQIVLSSINKSIITVVQSRPPETRVKTADGIPVTMIAVVVPEEPLAAVTETVVSVVGGTKITVTPRPKTMTTVLAGGVSVTLTSTPSPYVTTTGGTTTTMTRVSTPVRLITTVFTITINGTPTTMSLTLTPTPTPTSNSSSGHGYDGDNGNGTHVYAGTTPAQYFASVFLPTLLAVILALPISVIDSNAKLFQPFWALSQHGGASGPESMTLRYGGVHTVITPVRQLFQGHPVPFLTTLLMWVSWLLAPLAAEAIGVKVHGVCSHLSISGCAMAIGVSPWPARALIAVMSIMLVLLMVLAGFLHRWDTGVDHNPWNLADIALLSRESRLRDRLAGAGEPTEAGLNGIFRHGRFQLGTFSHTYHGMEDKDHPYLAEERIPAIIPRWEERPVTPLWPANTISTTITTAKTTPSQPKHHTPFSVLTYSCRTLFIALLLGLVTLLIYYHLSHGDTSFELFMDSQTFGVKFLFAAVGSLFALFWGSFFLSLAALTPFHSLSSLSGPQPAEGTITLTAPTNAFSGIYAAARHRQTLLLCAALMAIAAELLPVFLANIPYALTQTLQTHTVCTYLSVATLGAMVLVLAVSMGMKWPHMPLDPRTLAGAAYYVADSDGLVRDVVEAGRGGLGGRYYYARVVGADGRERMVVDAVG